MKKLIILTLMAILFILFSSCGKWKPMYVVHYEGCEYLMGIYRLSHSGTCPNPIHPENWTKEVWQEKLGLVDK